MPSLVSTSSADRFPALRTTSKQVVPRVAWLFALVAGAVVVFQPVPALSLPFVIAWLSCLLLVSLCLMMVRRADDAIWTCFAFALVLVITWTFGTSAGLSLAVLSAPCAYLTARNIERREGSPHNELPFVIQLGVHWLLVLPALFVALIVITLLGERLPISTTAMSLSGAALASAAALAVRLGFSAWLTGNKSLPSAFAATGYTRPWLLVDIGLTSIVPWLFAAFMPDTAWPLVALAGMAGAYLHRMMGVREIENRLTQRVASLEITNQGLRRVSEASRSALISLETNDACAMFVAAAIEITGAHAGSIYLVDSGTQSIRMRSSIGLSETQVSEWASLPYRPGEFDQDIQSLALPGKDTTIYPELNEGSVIVMLTEVRLRPTNKLLGLLRTYHRQQHTLTSIERELLAELSQQSGLLIDALDWFNMMENYAFEMAQLAHLARISSSSLSMTDVMQDMIAVLRQMVRVGRITLALVRTNSGASAVLELFGDAADPDTLSLEGIPELAALSKQQRPRPQQFKRSDEALSPALQTLIDAHGQTLAVFPLISYYDLLGLILLGDAEVSGLSDHQWQLLEMASNQIASHVLNARLYAVTKAALSERLEQLSILATIAQQISSALDSDTILTTMLEMAVRSTEASVGTVSLLQEAEDNWKIIQYFENGTLLRSQRSRLAEDGIVGQVSRIRQTLIIPDMRETTFYLASANPNLYLSAAAVPMISENKVIGVLLMESLRPDFFNREQVSFLSNLARHAVISIENARLLEERQRQILVLKQLQGLSLRLSSVMETSVVASEVLKTAIDLLAGRSAALFRVQDEDEKRRIDLLAESSIEPDQKPSALFRGSNIVLRTAQTGETQIVQDLRQPTGSDAPRLSAVSVPIKRGERVREVLCISFAGGHTFGKRELDAVALLASQAAGHLENATLHEYIRSGNDRMRAILNSTRDGIILLDKAGRLVETNPSARRLLGIDLDEHIGENMVDVLLQYASTDEFENAGYSREEVTALARQLRLEPERITRRQFARLLPKQSIYIEEIGSPVIDSDGQISGRLLVLRDVTEQKLLADYRDEITHMAVHDLRGPLASIISSLNFTLEEPGLSSDEGTLRKTLSLSLDSANNLMRLVESMLDIARLEKRQMPLKPSSLQLREIVDESVTALNSLIQAANVQVELDVPADLPAVSADRDMIRRVMINLLDNALRFTPQNGKIHVDAMECPDYLLIHVADSGPGIPADERERVFERFRQVKSNQPVRGAKGVGLGLTFTRLALEAHGGRIWVEQNTPLSGACFAVTLPYKPSVQ